MALSNLFVTMMKSGQLITWAAMCSMTIRFIDCYKVSPSLEEDLAHYVTKRPADYDNHTNASSVERMIRADLLKAMNDWNLAPETPEPEFDSYGNRRTPEPNIPQFWNAYRQAREGDRPSSWDNSKIDYESCLRRKNQEWTPSQESSPPYNGSTHEPFTWRTYYNTSSTEDEEVWTQPTLGTLESLEDSQRFQAAGYKGGHALPALMGPHRNNMMGANNRLQRRKQSLKHQLRQAINWQRLANGMKPHMQWSEVPRLHRKKSKQLHAERMRLRNLEKFEKNNIIYRNRRGSRTNYKQQMSVSQQQRSSPLLRDHIIRTIGLQRQLQSR